MLRPQVVEAVREAMFHIYAVSRIEDAAALLLDADPGAPSKQGRFPKSSAFGRVQDRLAGLADASRAYFPWTHDGH
jgi:hypothetical protein